MKFWQFSIESKRWLVDYISYATIGFVLVYLLFPNLGRPQNYFYGAILPPVLLYAIWNWSRFPKHSCLLVSFVLAIAYFSAAAFWGEADPADQWKLFRRGLYLVGYIIAVWVMLSRFDASIERLLSGFVWVAVFSALGSLIFYFLEFGVTIEHRFNPMLLPQPIYAAVVWGLAIVGAVYRVCTINNVKGLLLFLMASTVLGFAVLLTQSRGALFGIAVGLFALVAVHNINRRRWVFLMLSLAIVGTLGFFYTAVGDLLLERGMSYRLEIWSSVLGEVQTHPIFGSGWKLDASVITELNEFDHAHSGYLGTLRFSGVFGLIVLAALVLLYLKVAFSSKDVLSEVMAVWILLGLVNMLTDVSYVITRPDPMWFAIWLPMIVIAYRDHKRCAANPKIAS